MRVLVVDDDPDFAELVCLMLRLAGYEPIKALGGREGVKLASAANPHVMLLDLMMPDVSGFEVLRLLKGDRETRDIPVIVLTARVSAESTEEAISLGAAACLFKPYQRKELLEKISEVAPGSGH